MIAMLGSITSRMYGRRPPIVLLLPPWERAEYRRPPLSADEGQVKMALRGAPPRRPAGRARAAARDATHRRPSPAALPAGRGRAPGRRGRRRRAAAPRQQRADDARHPPRPPDARPGCAGGDRPTSSRRRATAAGRGPDDRSATALSPPVDPAVAAESGWIRVASPLVLRPATSPPAAQRSSSRGTPSAASCARLASSSGVVSRPVERHRATGPRSGRRPARRSSPSARRRPPRRRRGSSRRPAPRLGAAGGARGGR